MYVPAVENRDNASLPPGKLHESRLGHVKVNPGWVAPASVIGVLRPIWRTEVGGGDGGDGVVTIWRVNTFYLVTSPASKTIVEQR